MCSVERETTLGIETCVFCDTFEAPRIETYVFYNTFEAPGIETHIFYDTNKAPGRHLSQARKLLGISSEGPLATQSRKIAIPHHNCTSQEPLFSRVQISQKSDL